MRPSAGVDKALFSLTYIAFTNEWDAKSFITR
jgi:hypothetical protein